MSASPSTPLDYIAAGYWQDFVAECPVAGGIAYETALRACMLDESLESLQRIDTLLSQVRRDMIKGGIWDEAILLADEYYRNFIIFLAFYAGRVLAKHWQSKPQWYGQFELRKHHPELSLIPDDFYQHMAVAYNDDNLTTQALFFALEPIGLRLFGHIDRQFESVQGTQVASGLYQAVIERLAHSPSTPTHASDISASVTTPHVTSTTDSDTDSNIESTANISITQPPERHEPPKDILINDDVHESHDSAYAESSIITPVLPEELISQAPIEPQNLVKPELAKVEHSRAELNKPIKAFPAAAMLTQLLVELDEIEVPQTAGQDNYQQACKVLDQFERHIAKQNKPRDQIKFSDEHIAAKTQALQKIQASAEAGHTAAMLRLAMYELLNEGLVTDKNAAIESGTALVKQAASKNDSRAQRLLSKMYYQGVGVAQDIDNGKHWLEQAADNGHAGAASLVQQWQQAEILMTTQKQEQHSTKRYLWLFAAVIVAALLIIIIV